MSDKNLQYKITLREGATNVLRRVRGLLGGFGRGVATVFRPVLGLPAAVAGVMSRISRIMFNLPAILGGTAIAAAAAKWISAFGKQEQATLSLAGALRMAGDASKQTLRDMVAYSEALQKITTHGDETIQAAMALALNLGVPTNKLKEVTEAAIGLSARIGVDLQTAMTMFGRTAAGASARLRQYGIVIDETASHSERLNQLIAAGAQYFGLAEDQAAGVSGSMAQLRNSIGDLWERFGETIERVFGLSGGLDRLRERIENLGTERLAVALARIRQVAQVVGNAFSWLGDRIRDIARSEIVQGFVGRLVTGFSTVLGIVRELAAGTTTFGAVLGQLGTALGSALKIGFMEAVNVLQRGLQSAIAAATQLVMALPGHFMRSISVMQDPQTWAGMAQIIIGSLTAVGAYLIKIFTAPLDLLQAGMDTIMQQSLNMMASAGGAQDERGTGRLGRAMGIGVQDANFAANLKSRQQEDRWGGMAKISADFGRDQVADGMRRVAEAARPLAEHWRDAGADAGSAFIEEFQRSKGLLDTQDAREDLADALRGMRERYAVDLKLPEINIPEYVAPESKAGRDPGGNMAGAARAYGDSLPASTQRANISVGDRADWMRAVAAGKSPDEQIAEESRRMRELLEKIAKNEGVV